MGTGTRAWKRKKKLKSKQKKRKLGGDDVAIPSTYDGIP